MIVNIRGVSGKILRSFFSLIPISIYGDIRFKRGITFNIVTRNDPWFLESLLSILDIADEVVVVDSSDVPYCDYNAEIINRLNSGKLRYIHEDVNIQQAREKAKKFSTREVICHWDADMIAVTGGKDGLDALIARLLDRKDKFVVYFPIITFFTNLETILSKPYHSEGWIYSNSNREFYRPRIENAKTGTVVEGFQPPLYFKKLEIEKPLALHMSLMMPREKLAQKHLQKVWMNEEYKSRYNSFSEFLNDLKDSVEINSDYDTETYSVERFGTYPKWLERFLTMEYSEILSIKMEEIRTLKIPFT